MQGLLRRAFVPAFCLVLLLGLSNEVGADPGSSSVAERGQTAIAALGSRLPDVAKAYGLDGERLVERLLADRTLVVDSNHRLFYAEATLAEQTVGPAEPVVTPGSPEALAPLEDTFLLHSRPGAQKIIYLDFDGHLLSGTVWNDTYNGGADIVCPAWDIEGGAPVFTDTERTRIQQIWQRVTEDYAPFDVDVTTEYPGEAALTRSNAADMLYGMRVLVSPISSYVGPYGGVAYIGVFDAIGDYHKPALVFPERLSNGEKFIGEASSHENGHTLGLFHDGVTGGDAYYLGHGSGETGWAPIMGNGYYKNLTQWSRGEYAEANNTEDDLAVMLSNGLSYRPDNHGEAIATATPLPAGGNLSVDGFIGRTGDADAFSFQAGAGALSASVTLTTPGTNLDVELELRDSGGALVVSSNPVDLLEASVGTNVTAGTYYLIVKGTGKGNPLTGYSNYASLGAYSLNATLTPPAPATYTITPSASTGGEISPATVQTVDAGADITFTMNPDPGFVVSDVLVDDVSVGCVSSFEFMAVAADHTIEASFEAPTITVTAPNGAESWANGSGQNLVWDLSSAVSVGEFQVWLIDGAGNWVATVGGVAAVPAQTTYTVPWTVSAPPRADYRLDVLYRTDTGAWVFQAWDLSDGVFEITGTAAPTITVTAPNGAESWANGSGQNLVWDLSSAVSVGEFQVWLIDGAGNWVATVGGVAAVPAQTTYTVPWTVSAPPRADYRLDVLYRTDTGAWVFQAWDLSDGVFEITGTAAPTITVTAPNGAESWANGSGQNLVWDLSSAVSVGEFQVWLIDGAGNWVATVGGVAAVPAQTTYTVPWTVSAPPRADYRLDVLYRTDTGAWVFQAWDLSDGVFEITGTAAPTITVTAPNGTESWANGSGQNLVWDLSSAVSVGEFQVWLIDGAGNWVATVGGVAAVPAQTTYTVPWTVSAPPRADYRLDVLYRTDTGAWVFQAWDLSDGVFEVTGTLNNPPWALDDTFAANEDLVLNVAAPGVLGNDEDDDEDPLAAALVNTVGHGSLTLNEDGSFSYTPAAGSSGSDSFTYSAGDGQAVSNTATVIVTVTSGGSFSFAITADMQGRSGPGSNDSSVYFRGVCEKIDSLGESAFMVSPGDLDPPSNVDWTVNEYLGSDYLWYPAAGNHDEETLSDMTWLRAHNYDPNGAAPPHIINTGPSNCVETTDSFDYGNGHFVVLNEYYNGSSDTGTDGDVVDALYDWLMADLSATDKPHIFVFGHEPAYPQPDADNGVLRHLGDSLDKYPANRDRFWSVLEEFQVTAYICGHTHCYSSVQFDGVWQVNTGHSQGIGYTVTRNTFIMIHILDDAVTFETYRDNYNGGPYLLTDSGTLSAPP